MNAEYFAEWMRRQGHRVLKTRSSYWYEAGPRVLQACPYHWLIQPSMGELLELMVRHSVLALRYSTPLEADEGMVSYHAVLTGSYNLESMRSQARNGIRSGAKYFGIEPVPFERLASDGWRLQQDTLARQDRQSSMSQPEWERICLSAKDLPGFEAWGALQNGVLGGALIVARIGNTYFVPYAMSHREYLTFHVNNILFYTVCTDLLSREDSEGIFFCLHSLDAPKSVDEFKFRMGFQAKAVRQRVVFHPALQLLANRAGHSIVKKLLQRNPGSFIFSKAEGMLRFNLLGRLPIDQQEWPDCLTTNPAPGMVIPKKTRLPEIEPRLDQESSRTSAHLAHGQYD